MLPSHARANGSLPIPCMSCLRHRCSVSLSNKSSLSLSLSICRFLVDSVHRKSLILKGPALSMMMFDDVYYYNCWRLKLERETESICVCTKERKGVSAEVRC